MTVESWILVGTLGASVAGGLIRFCMRLLAGQAAQQASLEHIAQSIDALRADIHTERITRDKQVAELHRRINAAVGNGVASP